LPEKWSCGFRWFSFVPELYALVWSICRCFFVSVWGSFFFFLIFLELYFLLLLVRSCLCVHKVCANETCSVGILFLFLLRNLIFGLDCC
jgi:hypothetical protein